MTGRFQIKTVVIPGIFVILAFAINLVLMKTHLCIEEDGVMYATQGIRFFKGQGFYGIYPPTYPLLIGFLNQFLDNAELSARLVSSVFNALCMVPLFFMARWSFGQKTAVITCFLALIYPALAEYAPAALSESTYLFFFLTGITLTWTALVRKNILLFAVSGLVWGIAFLTRPEGMGYVTLGVLVLAYTYVKERKKTHLIAAGVFIFGFFLAAFPYLLNQKQQTGRWSAGNKTGLNLVLGEGVGAQQDWGTSFEKTYYSLSDDNTKLSYEYMLARDPGTITYVLTHRKDLIRRYIINLHLMNKYVIPGLLHPLVLILFAAGLFSRSTRETRRASVLFLTGIPYCAFPLFIVAPRYFIYFVPIVLIWAARGVIETAAWFREVCPCTAFFDALPDWLPFRKNHGTVNLCLESLLTALVVMTFIPFTFRSFMQQDTTKAIYREIGAWMQQNLPPGGKIIARKPWIPFYAAMEPVGFPFEPWDRIIAFAHNRNVSYLVADQKIIGNRKNLSFLFEDTYRSHEVTCIRKFVDSSGNKIIIYAINTLGR